MQPALQTTSLGVFGAEGTGGAGTGSSESCALVCNQCGASLKIKTDFEHIHGK